MMRKKKNNQEKLLNLNYSNGRQKINSDLLPVIECEWGKIVAGRKLKNKKIWNERLFRVQNLKEDRKGITIELGDTSYKKVFCTNNLHADIGDRFGDDFLGNNLGLFAIVETSDNFFLIGKRSIENEMWSFISGMVENNGESIRDGVINCAKKELDEELGIKDNHIKKIRFFGVMRGTVKHYDLIYSIKLNIDSKEVKNMWIESIDGEHSKIELVNRKTLIRMSKHDDFKPICSDIVKNFIVMT